MLPLSLATIPAEDEALRPAVREFLARQLRDLPASRRARSWMAFDADFTRSLAKQGWIGLTLPKEYGGGGTSQFARYVLIEELLGFGAPVAAHWIAERQSAPMILRYGSEAQKREIVPAICRGEAYFCIGMSEPDAGSDLASVRTRALPVPGGWRLNGTKLWTTYGHKAHYMIALVRTSGNPEDRSKGLSQFLINMSLPGVSALPIQDLSGDSHFSEVHFDDVVLPEEALLGSEGEGWKQVNAELAFERSGPERFHSSTVLVDTWLAYLRDRETISDEERRLAGHLVTQLATLRNLSISVTARLGGSEDLLHEAAIVKDLGTSFEQSIPELIAVHLSSITTGSIPDELLATLNYLTEMSPSFSLRGGTREILRGMIARGLGLR